MDIRSQDPGHRTAAAVALALLVAGAYGYARAMVTGTFSFYDDEGFMLMTLAQYVGGTPLYDGMYTEYGPFYYVATATLLRTLGWAVTHDSLRTVTIVSWVVVGLGWAVIVWAWSRSLRWAAACLLAAMVLVRLHTEPGHPQGLIQVLLLGVFVAVAGLRGRPSPVMFVLVGAICAAVLLTKVNIGIFLLLSLAVVFLTLRRVDRRSAIPDAAVNAAAIAMPAALMNRGLSDPATFLLCLSYTFGIGMLLYSLRRCARPELSWSAAGWGAVGFFVTFSLTVAALLQGGTSIASLLDGVVWQPIRFSRAIPVQTSFAPAATSAVCSALSSLVLYRRHKWRSDDLLARLQPRMTLALIVAAIVAPRAVVLCGPGLMWMLLPRIAHFRDKAYEALPALVIIVFATFAALIAYPVTGTQTLLAASFIMLGAFLGHFDRANGTPDARPDATSVLPAWALRLVAATALVVATADLALHFALPRTDSGLPNSRLVRLTPTQRATFEEIVSHTRDHCETLVTIPGMNSFNIWTGLPHPNGFTVSAAMVLFDAAAQEHLKQAFLTSRRPCLIYNAGIERWSARFRPHRTDQPFLDLIRHQLAVVYSRSGYEIRVPVQDAERWRDESRPTRPRLGNASAPSADSRT